MRYAIALMEIHRLRKYKYTGTNVPLRCVTALDKLYNIICCLLKFVRKNSKNSRAMVETCFQELKTEQSQKSIDRPDHKI